MLLKNKILVALIAVSYLLFVLLDLGHKSEGAHMVISFSLPLIAYFYFSTIKEKSFFFSLFLYLFALSEFLSLFSNYIPSKIDYYVGNSIYIMAYFFLLIEILKPIDLKYILRNFKLHSVVLIVLSIYVLLVLQNVMEPKIIDYIFEFVYNTLVISLLSCALINYFYHDDKKSFYLFLGALFIVSCEVIAVAYLYISEQCVLGIMSQTLKLIAFYFLYQQSRLSYLKHNQSSYIINSRG